MAIANNIKLKKFVIIQFILKNQKVIFKNLIICFYKKISLIKKTFKNLFWQYNTFYKNYHK